VVRSPCAERYPIQAGACTLSRWSGDPARCRWCDEPARADGCWCGHVCEDEYRRNHWWDQARDAALVRDGDRCVRCGLGAETLTVAKMLLRALIPFGPAVAAGLWRSPEWELLRQTCLLEVNHIVPRRGGGYGAGCHHHLDGLETLCRRCHAMVTAHQRRSLQPNGLAEAG